MALFLPASADPHVERRWHLCFANGPELQLISLLSFFWNFLQQLFYTHPHRERHTSRAAWELGNTFLLERHMAAKSEAPLNACTSSPPHLPFHICKNTSTPCQGSCFKEYDQPFASIISECKLRGRARSQVTQQGQGQLWVPAAPDLSLGDLFFLWLVFHHKWVEMKLFRARKLGDKAQLHLGEDTDVLKHQPNLHWSLSMSLVCRGIERVPQVPSMKTEVRTSSHSRQRERQKQCTPTLLRGLDKCGSKNL